MSDTKKRHIFHNMVNCSKFCTSPECKCSCHEAYRKLRAESHPPAELSPLATPDCKCEQGKVCNRHQTKSIFDDIREGLADVTVRARGGMWFTLEQIGRFLDLGDHYHRLITYPCFACHSPVGVEDGFRCYDCEQIFHKRCILTHFTEEDKKLRDSSPKQPASAREQSAHRWYFDNPTEELQKLLSLPTMENVFTFAELYASHVTASLRAERDRARKILIESIREIGGYATDEVSLDFLANLPEELRLLKKRNLESVTAIRKADVAELARVREALQHLLDHTEHKGDACKLLAVYKAQAALQPQVELPAKGEKNG